MTPQITKRFRTDLARLKSPDTVDTVEFLFNHVKTCNRPEEIPGFKWLTGFPGLGRISVGNYRIGLEVSGEAVKFCCVLHRSVIYSRFP